MKITKRIKFVSWSWIGAGSFLFLYSVFSLIQIARSDSLGISSGPFKATCESAVFSLLCLSGGFGLLQNKIWSKWIIVICAIILVLYSLAYFLFGGVLHRSLLYTMVVVLFSLVSMFTFFGIRRINA